MENTFNNIPLLDYVIGVQLEKIEKNIIVKSDGHLSEATEAAMANLVELLKLRNEYYKD
ncbi:MAG: hypothetical protein LBU74_04175 [Methanobacteriaceae archaeon]|jgi:hypothetical protein|nr:hypothetical protein [Candidatus Methanorudis spinitermitis]